MAAYLTGIDLIEWGYTPGPWFSVAIKTANEMHNTGASYDEIRAQLDRIKPAPKITKSDRHDKTVEWFLPGSTNDEEFENAESVSQHVVDLIDLPTVTRAAVMPNACPAGNAPGTIPVGGVVACENAIHPGFHSADVCCSVAISVFEPVVTPGRLLETANHVTHFGPGRRYNNSAHLNLDLGRVVRSFKGNPFLEGLEERAKFHFMTQGDGNHFLMTGYLDGKVVIVTHHGSRGLGAELYKRGIAVAQRETNKIASGIPKHQTWITADSQEGMDYWRALQITRDWTKLNHFAIHDAIAELHGAKIEDRWWNEHNFVFQKSDGLFYHAKGATPSYKGFSGDDIGLTLIPLNMRDGVIVARHTEHPEETMGFAPNGAGRIMSRSAYMRKLQREFGVDQLTEAHKRKVFERETFGIDARFWSGINDLSELPGAYKNARMIMDEIEHHDMAKITSIIQPYGSIMAGEQVPFWKKEPKTA